MKNETDPLIVSTTSDSNQALPIIMATSKRYRIAMAVGTVMALLCGVFLPSNVSSTSLRRASAQIIDTAAEDPKSIRNVANRSLGKLNANLQVYPKEECKVTVMITRHCNDYGVFARDDGETGDKHCSFVGYERTDYFAMKFESHALEEGEEAHRRWPMPSALYALLPDQSTQNGGINYRQIEMLLPLAKRTGVSIQVVATPEQVAKSVFSELQQNREVCGQIMVVAWKHRFIPHVAAALGCGPDQGCYESYPDGEFDQVWQLRFIYEPPAPEDEVMKLLDEGSSLLQDDYGYLAEQKKWQEQLTQNEIDHHQRTDRYQHPDIVTGWTVYGGRTDQDFDPLSSEYHRETEK
jgi:hypothetical protein